MNVDDDLKKKLALWEVKPEIPADFQRGVWSRIATRDPRSPTSLLEGMLAIPWLTPPRLAACALAFSVFAGSGLGLIESAQGNAKNWKTLEAKYVQSIDPYEHLGTY